MVDATGTSRAVGDVLRLATDYLTANGVAEAPIIAGLLLSRLLGCRRLDLPLRATEPMPERLLEAMRRGMRRVAGHEPVQYVLGQTDFMGHLLRTDRRALIPRPETEELVAWVLDDAGLWALPHPAIADVGTGSGCIALALALARPRALCLALDISSDAVVLAGENFAALGLAERIGLAQGELADVVDAASLDAIVANPPYIATADWERLPPHIREHEPRLALDGGPDGLAVIEPLVQDAAMALKPDGRLYLEIGAGQMAAVKDLLRAAGFERVEGRRDLAGHERMVCGRLA